MGLRLLHLLTAAGMAIVLTGCGTQRTETSSAPEAGLMAGTTSAGAMPQNPPAGKEVLVFAAASLTDPFQELAPAFSREHGGAKVTFNFAGSQQLRTQLTQGVQADVLVTADQTDLDRLVEEERLEAPAPFLRNRLVLIVPKTNPAGIRGLGDLTRKTRLVMGVADVPFGKYARQVLRNAEAAYGHGFYQRVMANVVSEEPSVKQSLAKVVLGEADAGFVYATDVTAAVSSRVQTVEVPEEFNVTAIYSMAVVKDAPHPTLARDWVMFMQRPETKEVLRRSGFIPW